MGPADGGARLWILRSWRSIATLLRNWNTCSRSKPPKVESSAVEEFFFARDLRPSSDSFVPEQDGRGEIAQAIVAAIRDAGMRAINLGSILTPALTCYALARGKGSIMVTGSHIPFDRNGYKTNTSKGELLKQQEAPIHEQVRKVRQSLYDQPQDHSLFDERGFFKTGHQDLPKEQPEAHAAWIGRFASFFKGASLEGNLSALLTRDVILLIFGVLLAASGSGLNVIDLFDRLPKRFSRAHYWRISPGRLV